MLKNSNTNVYQQLVADRPNICTRRHLTYMLELSVREILRQYNLNGKFTLHLVNKYIWRCCDVTGENVLNWHNENDKVLSSHMISYNRSNGKQRFAILLYILSEVHYMLLVSGSCMLRELYYKQPLLVKNPTRIYGAVNDVCKMLCTEPGYLGIISSAKGLVAGALRMIMHNGDIIDCSSLMDGVLLPPLLISVQRFETNASFVLIVEKETVFKQIWRNYCNGNNKAMILVTGKGYPDCNTRFLIHRLYFECMLPIYALVDADPYGIEILLTYQNVSQNMCGQVVPQIRWLGLHPSEVDGLKIPTIPLSKRDNKKLCDLQSHKRISLGVQNEILTMQRMQRKAELDTSAVVHKSFLYKDYILSKIERGLVLYL